MRRGTCGVRLDIAFRRRICSCSNVERSHQDEMWSTEEMIEGHVTRLDPSLELV